MLIKKQVVGIFEQEDFLNKNERVKSNKKIPVVIIAGGFGKRLPFTNVLPKPLIPINEEPVIDIIMKRFLKFGLNKFFISINFKSNIIKCTLERKK